MSDDWNWCPDCGEPREVCESLKTCGIWNLPPSDVEEENLSIAHELGACGGDCPDCQRERQERAEERQMEFGDPDYQEELDVP